MAVRSWICGLSRTAGELSGVPAKSLGLRIVEHWVEVALKSVLCDFKINLRAIARIVFLFFLFFA